MGLEQEYSAVEDYGNSENEDDADVGRNLTTSLLTDFMNKVNAMNTVTENDSNYEHSTKVKIDVYDVLPCGKEILREKKVEAKQSPLDAFFKKKADSYFEMSHSRANLLVRIANLYSIHIL
jgi:hypothetical protein